jgi:DnaJ-class molecular chaperone
LVNGAIKERVQYADPQDMEDLFGSETPYSDFFANIFGKSRGSGRATQPGPRRGRDVEYEVDLTLEEVFHGAERSLEMNGRGIKAGIPAGVRTGSRVRLAGQAEPGQNGGPAGDLYLIIKILPNAIFERDGDDLTSMRRLIFLRRCRRRNPHPAVEAANLTIPSGTTPTKTSVSAKACRISVM